ncbi:MAG TPA: M23 family metallopeptidase, partial [Erysipelothrix sp.]|nr:M23 family metallopeptidase [Erysipelothrix sp.]
ALMVEKINSIAPVVDSQGGMLRPISSGFHVSASVWSYASGHKHLGIDLAAPVGTSIVAPANGIVIATYTGCATYGGLSNTCGMGYGNYVLMMVRDSGSTYGALYGHMQSGGVLVGVGQSISQGQVIGRVGSSGTSTGPHVHGELFYLGTDSVQETYDRWYSGSKNIQFGLGGSSWGNEYSNRCDVKGYSANCRMNPSSYWGLYVGNSH